MSGIDTYTWYVLSNFQQSVNNTLTASQDAQDAFISNSLRGIYLAPATSQVPYSQQWQLSLVNSSSASAYILRNRQTGAEAYVTTAWSTRQCGGGNCATVPVLASYLNAESLWDFGSWGFSDPTGGAYVYNLGNSSKFHLDSLDGLEYIPGLTDRYDTGRGAQHWNLTAYAKFNKSESTLFQTVPPTAAILLAQAATSSPATSVITPYTVPSISSSGSQISSTPSGASPTPGTSSQRAGLTTGASVGIGVGITTAVFAVAIVAYLIYRRRRNRRNVDSKVAQASSKKSPPPEPKVPELASGSKPLTSTKIELMGDTPAELDQFSGSERAELDHGRIRHELSP